MELLAEIVNGWKLLIIFIEKLYYKTLSIMF